MTQKWYRDDYTGDLNGWGFVTLFSIGIIVFCLLFVLLIGVVERRGCGEKADEMSRAWRWGYFSGCMVQTSDGGWVPIENFRVIEG